MPNKPLLRFLIIALIVAVLALFVAVLSKRTWYVLIKRKWKDTPAAQWTWDFVKDIKLGELVGIYFNGHPSFFPDTWKPV